MRNNQKRLQGAANLQPQMAPSPVTAMYAVPTEFVELPSRGKFYPEGHALHGEDTIEIRYMTAKEEDILSSAALIEKGLVIDRLLQSIIVPDVKPESLLVGDRNAIMIAARISSYGQAYKASVNCPACSTRVDYVFDLSKTNLSGECFSSEFLKDKSITIDPQSGLFELTLPTSKATIKVKLLTGLEEKKLSNLEENKMITSTLSNFICEVNGDSNPNLVHSFIQNMPAADSKFIRNLYPRLSPNIDLRQEFTCENCAHQSETEVPLTAEFFWPG